MGSDLTLSTFCSPGHKRRCSRVCLMYSTSPSPSPSTTGLYVNSLSTTVWSFRHVARRAYSVSWSSISSRIRSKMCGKEVGSMVSVSGIVDCGGECASAVVRGLKVLETELSASQGVVIPVHLYVSAKRPKGQTRQNLVADRSTLRRNVRQSFAARRALPSGAIELSKMFDPTCHR